MFICNLKFSLKKTLYICSLILIVIVGFTTYKIFSSSNFKVKDNIPKNSTLTVNTNNYTDTLKLVYENINAYSGTKIKICGFIFRNDDFANDQFVIARTMQTENNGDFIVRFLMFI